MASSGLARKKGKKNAKHGRNTFKCRAYSSSNRREKNKVKRVKRHLAHHPQDACARHCLAALT